MAALAAAAMALLALSAGSAHASPAAADTDDHYKPASASVAGTSTNIAFVYQPPIFTATCSNSRLSGKTPATGLAAFTIAPPPFNNGTGPCRDGVGDTHTISTSGTWKIRIVDAVNDEASTEPNTGDSFQLIIPQKGLTDVTTLGICVITFAPTAPVTVTGAYDDHTTFTFKMPNLPVAASGGAGCPLLTPSTVSFTGTYTFSAGLSDTS